MSGLNDRELDDLKTVSCAVLLERQAPPYTLDRSESTRNCLKYRRGKGEIILVTHGGRGWWDPGSTTAKGNIFNLVQHLQPCLNFGQARRVAAAEGAVHAYAHITGEEWKAYEAPVSAASSISHKSATEEMGACG